MEMDLKEAMRRTGPSPFPQSELKSMLHQILSGTNHIHQKWLLHRDLKTSNILVHRSGRIALGDFGLARRYEHPLKSLTLMVITLWYRPPELLMGETVYGPAVDIWRYVQQLPAMVTAIKQSMVWTMYDACSSAWLSLELLGRFIALGVSLGNS